jgi:hypothetical protein
MLTMILVFTDLKRAMAANPFYLGTPEHIRLRRSNGSALRREMNAPAPGTPSPEKWYCVTCGTAVGIFLSWYVPHLPQPEVPVLTTPRTDADPHVTRKKGSAHKSFKTEEEAFIRMQAAVLKGTVELIN